MSRLRDSRVCSVTPVTVVVVALTRILCRYELSTYTFSISVYCLMITLLNINVG